MFNMFPYVNLHKINLDWIITTVNNAVSTIQHSVRQIEAALDSVNGLTGRVGNLEESVQQLQEANTSLEERVSHSETQITSLQSDLRQQGATLNSMSDDVTALQDRVSHAETQITTAQSDLRQQGSTLDSLSSNVTALSTAVAGKVDNGSNTIVGSANLLTVAGANSGEVVSIDGNGITITGTGGNDVRMTVDTAGEPGSSESVLRLARHDDTSPGPVRITNVGRGQAATDAVNVGQLVEYMPRAIQLTATPTSEGVGTWTGATWEALVAHARAGGIITVTMEGVHLSFAGMVDSDGLQIITPNMGATGFYVLQSDGTWST